MFISQITQNLFNLKLLLLFTNNRYIYKNIFILLLIITIINIIIKYTFINIKIMYIKYCKRILTCKFILDEIFRIDNICASALGKNDLDIDLDKNCYGNFNIVLFTKYENILEYSYNFHVCKNNKHEGYSHILDANGKSLDLLDKKVYKSLKQIKKIISKKQLKKKLYLQINYNFANTEEDIKNLDNYNNIYIDNNLILYEANNKKTISLPKLIKMY